MEDLEARLQASWDDETAAVYADALIAAGDPRGELLAIDLHVAAHGPSPELAARRRQHLHAWLGEELLGHVWEDRDVERGLVAEYVLAQDHERSVHMHAEALLASPAAGALRGLQILVRAPDLPSILDLLAERSHPWLRQVWIATNGDAEPVPRAVMKRFVAATPHLEEMTLQGAGVLATPGHPNVRMLRLVGTEALVVADAAMPSVTTLDVSFVGTRTASPGRRASIANPRLFPALRRIDLSRNELTYPTAHHSNTSILPVVEAIERLEGIEQVRLPSLRGDDDLVACRRLLAQHPGLELTVARMYRSFAPVSEPRLHIPPPRPWPPSDTMSSRAALSILPPGEEVALSWIIDELEGSFDDMPAAERDAWVAFWAFVDALPPEEDANPSRPFDTVTLLRALESIPDDRRAAQVVRDMRAWPELPRTVSIHHYWGW